MFDDTEALVVRLRHVLSPSGLDLVHAFDVKRYNAAVVEHPVLRPVECFGRDEGALALLVGNSRAMWRPFLEAYGANPSLRASSDPVDHYVERALNDALRTVPIRARAFLAHERGPQGVSMLHVARESGFAVLSPAQLAVHPVLGPWFGLRALLVLDAPAPARHEQSADPCARCARPCVPAFDAAMASFRDQRSIAVSWRSWLAVRDACPVGRDQRYGDDQIRYHYTKERAHLRVDSAR